MTGARRRATRRKETRRRSRNGTGMRRHMIDLLLMALLSFGLVNALEPVACDLYSSAKADQVISGITDRVDETNDERRLVALAQAQAYNLSLGGEGASLNNAGMKGGNEGQDDILEVAHRIENESISPYEEQLSDTQMAAMCWIEIPAIAVREPIYHGTSDATLSMGVGHLSWSSLPVGGTSSHCVLAAHSAMEKTRMFDQLDRLSEGDVFTLHVLGDAYSYEVYSTEVVLPKDAPDACQIVGGQDLCTLVTCTPYAINSHRLLVHGKRVPYKATPQQPTRQLRAVATSRQARPLLSLLAAAGIALVVLLIVRTARLMGRQVHGREVRGRT